MSLAAELVEAVHVPHDKLGRGTGSKCRGAT